MKFSALLWAFIPLVASADLTVSSNAEKPTPASEPRFGREAHLSLGRGETRGIWLKLTTNGGCETLAPSARSADGAVSAVLYQAVPIQVTTPSSNAGRAGSWLDPLVEVRRGDRFCPPRGQAQYFFVDVSAGPGAAPGLRALTLSAGRSSVAISARVTSFKMPTTASLPFHLRVENWTSILGHFRGDPYKQGVNHPGEAAYSRSYQEFLVAHRIAPYGTAISTPKASGGLLDLDEGGSPLSFRKTVLATHPAPMPVEFRLPEDRSRWSSYLPALERTVRREGLVGRAWVYVEDEPDLSNRSAVDRVVSKLHDLQRLAPSVLRMVTAPWHPELARYRPVFTPVMNWWSNPDSGKPGPEAYRGHPFWLYVSCMSHGCGPSRLDQPNAPRNPGRASGDPDLVIDRGAAAVRAFVWAGYQAGASGLLYYNAIEAYRLAPRGIDPWTDPWNFGGNGDGNLLYPIRPGQFGRKGMEIATSVRLKLIREALFDIEYFRAKRASVARVVPGPRGWSPRYSDYQDLRDSIADTY